MDELLHPRGRRVVVVFKCEQPVRFGSPLHHVRVDMPMPASDSGDLLGANHRLLVARKPLFPTLACGHVGKVHANAEPSVEIDWIGGYVEPAIEGRIELLNTHSLTQTHRPLGCDVRRPADGGGKMLPDDRSDQLLLREAKLPGQPD